LVYLGRLPSDKSGAIMPWVGINREHYTPCEQAKKNPSILLNNNGEWFYYPDITVDIRRQQVVGSWRDWKLSIRGTHGQLAAIAMAGPYKKIPKTVLLRPSTAWVGCCFLLDAMLFTSLLLSIWSVGRTAVGPTRQWVKSRGRKVEEEWRAGSLQDTCSGRCALGKINGRKYFG
jgi:hypothetical protein